MRYEKSSGGFIVPTVTNEDDKEPVAYRGHFHHKSQHSEASIQRWKEWVDPGGIMLPDTNADSFCYGFDAAMALLNDGGDK